MWCKSCRQEVPGIAAAQDKPLRCARCGAAIGAARGITTTSGRHDSLSAEALAGLAGWDLEDKLQEVDRLLARSADLGEGRPQFRIDPAQPLSPGRLASRPDALDEDEALGSTRSGSTLAWFSLALGLAASVCGSALLGWAQFSARPDLWKIGLPGVLVGQLAVVIGLVLLVDQVWDDNRRSAQRITELESHLGRLKSRVEAARATETERSR